MFWVLRRDTKPKTHLQRKIYPELADAQGFSLVFILNSTHYKYDKESQNIYENQHHKKKHQGFPGGAVVGSLPTNAGDMGSSPGLGRSHMPWNN